MISSTVRKKKGGNPINNYHTNDFWDMINYCELIYLGFYGIKYTWINKRFHKNGALIFKRPNHFFANNDWLMGYSESHVTHLPRTHLDQCPLLLKLSKSDPTNKVNIFRFEKMWASHSDFPNLVKQSWGSNLFFTECH